MVKKKIEQFRGQVKIGCEFYMEAEGNVDFVAVETGVPGLFIELNPNEALEYIPKREKFLEERLERCNHCINDIQQHIDTINRSLSRSGEVNIEEPCA